MALSVRQLRSARLDRQLLLERRPLGVVEAVRHLVALQAQSPPSPYLALANRLADFDPAGLDAAFADGRVLKATSLRGTLHAVAAPDHAVLHGAVLPSLRAARLGDPRFTVSGWTPDQAVAAVPALLAHLAEPRSSAESEQWLDARTPGDGKGAWWALRTVAPVGHAPTGGPWSFGQRPAFRATVSWPPRDPDEALVELARRYLRAYGPASVADLATFAMVTRARAREALSHVDTVLLDGPDGRPLLDLPDAVLPDEDAVAPPRLLGMWDGALLAHADRAVHVPPELRKHVTRANGDWLPTLLVDGQVVGVWRTVEARVEATALLPVADAAWDGLADEAQRLLSLLADRDPRPYGRYDHWWGRLPPGQVRLLS